MTGLRPPPMSGQPSDVQPDPAPEAAAPVSLAALILPFVTAIATVLVVFLFVGHDAAAELLVKAVAIATVAGKFAVLLDTPDGFLSTPYHMAAMITCMDLMFGVICIFNVGVLFRIRGFGKKLQELQGFCKLMLRKNPWMRKATFAGTVAFVMFPLSGTGAIGGSLFSQILGMSRARAMLAILVGALIGSFGLAYLADTVLPDDVQDSWLFKIGGLLFILVVVGLLTKLYKSIDPEAMEDEEGEAEQDA